MLTLDVAQMSHAELVDAVSRRCSQFGPVREIAILQPPDQPGVAFALVGMRALRDIDKVVAGLGAAKVATLAAIRVQQAPAAAAPAEFAPAAQAMQVALA